MDGTEQGAGGLPGIGELVARHGVKWSEHGPGVLPAWIADMDFPVARPIREALAVAVERSDLGYPPGHDHAAVREAFSNRARQRYGLDVPPDRVVLTTDVLQGLYQSVLTLTAPGDGILVQTPIYPPFLAAVAETGRRLVEHPLVPGTGPGGGYGVDMEGLEAVCRTDHPRALLLCNPHNPTGRSFTEPELVALAELACRHDLVVVADEIHADLVLEGSGHRSIGGLDPEVGGRTVTLNSTSKAFSIAGVGCAVAAFGSARLADRFASVPDHARGAVSGLGLLATLAAWRDGDPWLTATLERLRANRDVVASAVADRMPGVVDTVQQATYLAWLDCRAAGLGDDPAAFFLERAGVALSPGPSFGVPGRGFARLNFATTPEVLAGILDRMAEALAARSPG